MNTLSILGSNLKDIFVFYTLPILLILGIYVSPTIWNHPILVFVIYLFIDMGHAYSTVFRTYLRKKEIQKIKYWIIPIITFIVIFYWAYSGTPYLWSFLLYFTFFHHIRQYYGISAWYAKKQKYDLSKESKHIYLLTVIPFIIFHFRDVVHTALYQENELFLFGDTVYTKFLIFGYLIYFSIQCFKWTINPQIKMMLKISLLYPVVIHVICFLFFKESFKAFIPLLVMHGISYIALVAYSMKKIQKVSYFKVLPIILSFVFICVFAENLLLDDYDVFVAPYLLKNNILLSSIASIAVLPNLLHYIFDGFIWKKSNEDFVEIIKD